jgi:hypothetical protein
MRPEETAPCATGGYLLPGRQSNGSVDRPVRDRRLLAPVPLPARHGLPAEAWPQPPTHGHGIGPPPPPAPPCPRRGSDAYQRGAHPPLRSIAAQGQPGNGERHRQASGGTGAVVASHLSPPGSTHIFHLRRSGGISLQRRGARSELEPPARACADAFYPVINYEKG